jgi:hypothetical protein
MPRVGLYENSVQRQGTTDARVRAADFGPSPLAAGLQFAGEALSKVVDKRDEIEDVKARVEANRLSIEHSEHVRQIGRTVTETLGEGAETAANNGIAELEKTNKELLGRASPRARLLLQNDIATRTGTASDQWLDHGFRQQADALETSSVARANRVIDDAASLDDEHAATAMLAEIPGINAKRAQFFGKGKDWLDLENHKMVSSFYRSRALKLTQGMGGSASAAIGYAERHRSEMTFDDYNAIASAYNDSAIDEGVTSLIYGGSPVGAHTEAAPADDGGPPARLDPNAFFKSFVSPHEGSTYVVDSNGAGVKYGINEKSNPGVDVKNLTEDKAAAIFKANYFIPSGADKLPPALAAIHADTYYMNQKQAGKILRESGGDVDKYIELRRSFLNSLADADPKKYGKYRKAWNNRTDELAAFADRQGGDGTALKDAIGPDTNLESIRNTIMARTDVGLNFKKRAIAMIEARRTEVRQEQAIQEDTADRQLTQSMLNLGDKFTDVKQLPQDVYLSASPATRAKFNDYAKENKKKLEDRPLTPQQAARLSFIQTFNPTSFADPKVQQQLIKEGVPLKKVTELAAAGGAAMGKVDAIPREQLESVARTAYEAAGYRFWSTENKGTTAAQVAATANEQKFDAMRQQQLLTFLDHEAHAWAVSNPGKTADLKTIQGWVATSLIHQHGVDVPIGAMNDQELVNAYGQNNFDIARMRLRANGIEPTMANTAEYLRRRFAAMNPR